MRRMNIYKHRYVYFVISLLFILTGLVVALTQGVKLDIQFQGGAILEYSYSGTIDADKAAAIATQVLNRTATAQLQTNLSKSSKTLIINLSEKQSISSSDQQSVTAALEKAFPDSKVSLYESLTVEPFIGGRFFQKGLLAIALAFLLILLYVGYRFRKIGGFSAGAMAILALFHDAFVVTSAFMILRIPLNDTFIAAILTVLGFSINDTIVVYDRIRENKGLLPKKTSAEDLVDISITQSFTRSVNTNVSIFLSITVCYIFAVVYNIQSIEHFALPMMIGTVSGCYSTICIAGPLWAMWQNRKRKPAAPGTVLAEPTAPKAIKSAPAAIVSDAPSSEAPKTEAPKSGAPKSGKAKSGKSKAGKRRPGTAKA